MLSKNFGLLACLALAGTCLVAACGSSSDSHGAPISIGGAAGAGANASAGAAGKHHVSGGSGGSPGSGGSNSADAGEAGTTTADAGAGGEQQGTVVVVTPGACTETPTWAGATPLGGVSTAGQESLLAITTDELDIAFLRGGALYLAHRAAASGSFDGGSPVAVPTGYDPTVGVALSSDGRTLVLVSKDGQSFGALTRSSRTARFSAIADTTAFAGLNERAIQTLEHYASPVLAPNGKSFVFSAFTVNADGTSVVYEALLSAGAWAMPNDISANIFDGTNGKRPLPTGLSSDSRTLFYFDEATSKEVARFRDRPTPDAPLYDNIDLGDLAGAAPNANCDRIYYSAAGNVLSDTD